MAVTNDTIIQKMEKELAEAKRLSNDDAGMKAHIAHIHLLCELLLEEKPKSATPSSSDMTADEMKAMLGQEMTGKPLEGTEKRTEQDGANGHSIFDF
ncbi:hypothetical protein GCM10008983_10850 [Lentibacillus halophilus]|uniref:YwdI family protein n=1 Tax=Lentibacillus halophilus TaxID=295065 RepID=A0ABN0Z7T3_9BACI